jgi:hypothetical protein
MKWQVQVALRLADGGATECRTGWYLPPSHSYALAEELFAGAAA